MASEVKEAGGELSHQDLSGLANAGVNREDVLVEQLTAVLDGGRVPPILIGSGWGRFSHHILSYCLTS